MVCMQWRDVVDFFRWVALNDIAMCASVCVSRRSVLCSAFTTTTIRKR